MAEFADYEKLDKNMPDLKFQYEGDCCFDLMSAVDITINPGEVLPTKVPLGVKFDVPKGHEIQIRSRSGLAAKNGIAIFNQPGCIDSGYKGELQALLVNISTAPFKIDKYDRICQGKIAVAPKILLRKIKKVKKSEREANGFNSTGVKNN